MLLYEDENRGSGAKITVARWVGDCLLRSLQDEK